MGEVLATYRGWMFRTYLDLGPPSSGPLHQRAVDHAYQVLCDPSLPPLWAQRAVPAPFRDELVRQTGLWEYRARVPSDLPEHLRTERWQHLCDLLDRVDELSRQQQGRLGRLLNTMCLYRATLEALPELDADEVSSDADAAFVTDVRATARYVLNLRTGREWDEDYQPDDMCTVAERAPLGSRTKLNAALRLTVYFARIGAEVEVVRRWRDTAEQALAALEGVIDSFDLHLARSTFYRGVAYEPFLRGDKEQVAREFELAEEYAYTLPRETETQAFLADDNLSPLIESSAKVALWLGDPDLALERARSLVELEPLDAITHIELAEMLMKRERFEEAAHEYAYAGRIGPPGTQVGLYMAGHCYEHLDDLEQACRYYLAATDVDPWSISPLIRLREVGRRLGESSIVDWVRARIEELTQAGLLPADPEEEAARAEVDAAAIST